MRQLLSCGVQTGRGAGGGDVDQPLEGELSAMEPFLDGDRAYGGGGRVARAASLAHGVGHPAVLAEMVVEALEREIGHDGCFRTRCRKRQEAMTPTFEPMPPRGGKRYGPRMAEDGDAMLKAFGRRLRLARERIYGYRSRLARAARIGDDRLKTYEDGRNFPHAMIVVRLADALGVTVDWLYRGHTTGLSPEKVRLLTEPESDKPPRKPKNRIT